MKPGLIIFIIVSIIIFYMIMNAGNDNDFKESI